MNLCNKEIAGSKFTAYMAFVNLAEIAGAYLIKWIAVGLATWLFTRFA